MISLQLIDKKIMDYEQNNLEETPIRFAKIDILYWVKQHYNEDNIKTKIQRLQEELLAISNNSDLHYRIKEAKIHELQLLIK